MEYTEPVKGVQMPVDMAKYKENLEECHKYTAENFAKGVDKSYDDMAKRYDEILEGVVGFADPQIVAKECAKRIPKDALTIDFGCGTGLVGKYLKEEGFVLDGFVGIDASQGMLDAAKAREGVYKSLVKMFVGNGELPKEFKGQYDLAVSSANFIPHHFPNEALDEILESLKVGGHFVVSLREDAFENLGHRKYFEKTIAEGKMKEISNFSYLKHEGIEQESTHGLWIQTTAHIKTFQKL